MSAKLWEVFVPGYYGMQIATRTARQLRYEYTDNISGKTKVSITNKTSNSYSPEADFDFYMHRMQPAPLNPKLR